MNDKNPPFLAKRRPADEGPSNPIFLMLLTPSNSPGLQERAPSPNLPSSSSVLYLMMLDLNAVGSPIA